MKNREDNEKMALYNFIEEEPKKDESDDDEAEKNNDKKSNEEKEKEELEERKRKIKEKLKEGIDKGKQDKDSNDSRELGGRFNLKGFVMLL
ncbi:MAG: ATP-dependent zinc metalloprotease FtsH, partial [Cetobacterium sp.]